MSIIVPIITTPYIARVLEAEGVGKYSTVANNSNYFVLLAVLGLGTYGQLETAKCKDDIAARSKCFIEIVLTKCITHGISLLLYIVLVIVTPKYKDLYLIQGTVLFSSLLDVTWFFQGLEEFKKISIRNIIIKLVSVTAILCFVRTREDVGIYTFILAFSSLISSICLLPSLRKNICRVDMTSLNLLKHVKGSLVFFVPSIASMIISTVDKTMIDAFTQMPEENGYYAEASKIELLCFSLFSSLNLIMRSRMAYLFHNKHKDETSGLLLRSMQFVVMIAYPITVGTIAITNRFVPWFFGPGFEKVTVLLPMENKK